MKKYLTSLILILSIQTLVAQDWESDWKKSLKRSNVEDKKLILVFSGSDWCIPCIRLEKEVWMNDTFIAFATDNLVLYRADFPKRKKNKLPEEQKKINEYLASQFNPNGYFPYVVVLSPKGKVLGSFAYEKKQATDYIQQIKIL